ncbi:hypothetical protein MASR1M101_17200 [Gemmatimonas sp.]
MPNYGDHGRIIAQLQGNAHRTARGGIRQAHDKPGATGRFVQSSDGQFDPFDDLRVVGRAGDGSDADGQRAIAEPAFLALARGEQSRQAEGQRERGTAAK